MTRVLFFVLCACLIVACNQKSLDKLSIQEIDEQIVKLEDLLDSLQTIRLAKIAVDTSGQYTAVSLTQLEEVFDNPKTATIKIKTDTSLHLSKLMLVQDMPYQNDIAKIIQLNAEGTGILDVEVEQTSDFKLRIGKMEVSIFLKPEETIGVLIDSIDGIAFIGDLQQENQWMLNQSNSTPATVPDSVLHALTSTDDFSVALNDFSTSLYNNRTASLDESFDKDFKNMVLQKEYCQKNRRILPYSSQAATAANVDEEFLNRADLFGYYEFRKLIFEYLEIQAEQKLENYNEVVEEGREVEYFTSKYELIETLFSEQKIIEFLKTDVLFEAIAKVRHTGLNDLVRRFQNEVTYQPFQTTINSRYISIIKPSKGAIAPSIKGVTFAGEDFDLLDYRGQYVYIFTWATWCGPCKVELPFYERMIEDYQDENILFVGISVDKDKSKWTESFFYDNYPGLQVLVPGDWKSPFVRDYNIASIPQFVLINPDGEIAELNAERPTKNIKAQLIQYGIYPRVL